MSSEWRSFSRTDGFETKDDTILVKLAEGRSQEVYIDDDKTDGYIRAWSIAAGPSALNHSGEGPEQFAWRRNHVSDLVGFKSDRKGRLVGEIWVPKAGLDAQEWAVYVIALARSCDRMEYLLTGKDQQ